MTLSLCVKSGSCVATFEYHGEQPELWLQSVKRVLRNPKFQVNMNKAHYGKYNLVSVPDWQDALSLSGVRSVKDRIRLPEFFIEIENTLELICKGEWHDVEIEVNYSKSKARKVWLFALEDGLLQFEQHVYEALLQDGNGGLTVDQILERLLLKGSVATFSMVRVALAHLETLFLVEFQHGMFSVRYGIVE